MRIIKTKTNLLFILISLFLAIICAILFILQNYSKIEFTASVDEEDDAGNRVMQSYHINGGQQDYYEYNYGSDGSLTSIDKHDGSITYGYNATGQLISKKTVYGSSNIHRYNYQYLAVPNTSNNQVTNLISSSSFTVGVASSTYSYTYYPNGNLKCVFKDGNLQKEYVYDEYDRLTVENDYELNYQWWNAYDIGGNILYRKHYQLNPNILISTTYRAYTSAYKDQLTYMDNILLVLYDDSGNITRYNGKIMTWQNGRELKTVNGHINYKYDYSGLRTQKNVSGITTDYYLEGSRILMEKRSDQQYGYWYFYDESGVYGVQIAGINYIYEKNILGDVTALYNMYTGAKVGEYRYDAWGNILNISEVNNNPILKSNPFRYRGYYYDNETKFYYLNSRYYDPAVGRFINADDPTMLYENASVAMGANLYAYCLNNPIMYTDSSGYGVFLDMIMSGMPGSYLSGIDYGEFVIPGVDPVLMHYIDSLLQVGLGIGMMFLPGAQYLGAGIIGAGVGGIVGGHISEAVGGTFSQGYSIGNFVGGFIGGGIKGIASGIKAMKFASSGLSRSAISNAIKIVSKNQNAMNHIMGNPLHKIGNLTKRQVIGMMNKTLSKGIVQLYKSGPANVATWNGTQVTFRIIGNKIYISNMWMI